MIRWYVIHYPPIPWKRPGGMRRRYDEQKQEKLYYGYTLKKQCHVPALHHGALFAIFHMPIPKKRERKIQEGDKHIVKPDSSNLTKFLEDAGNGIIWDDDARLWFSSGLKLYSKKPRTELYVVDTIEELLNILAMFGEKD